MLLCRNDCYWEVVEANSSVVANHIKLWLHCVFSTNDHSANVLVCVRACILQLRIGREGSQILTNET